jgi:hypothetical protein
MVSEQDLAERLAQFAWAVHTGDKETLQALRRVIEAGGGTWEEDGNQVTCTGPSGIRGGIRARQRGSNQCGRRGVFLTCRPTLAPSTICKQSVRYIEQVVERGEQKAKGKQEKGGGIKCSK